MKMNQDTYLQDWKEKEELAEAMLPLIGQLYRDQGIVLSIYGRKIVRQSAIGILKAHRYARQLIESELSVRDSYPLLQALSQMDLAPARVDLGKLTTQYAALADSTSIQSFLRTALAQLVVGIDAKTAKAQTVPTTVPTDVVLYGFGRIGRLLARILIERTGGGDKLRLRAIVVRPSSQCDLHKRASLLRRDSVHGPFHGTIKVLEEENALLVNGNLVKLLYAGSPDKVDYTAHGINNCLVIDNTGIWRDEEALGLHLKSAGVAKVLLTAPGKGSLKNIIYGVNHSDIDPADRLISAASCTTNAIVPVLKVVDDKYGILNGHLETVHSYTNDQNLTDNFHKKERRGRGAPLNLVITETGAASAVSKALPALKGKLTGNAIRVPTPNVSLAILNLNLADPVTRESLNDYLRTISLESELRDQIDYVSSAEVVSSDLVGSHRAGIVDSKATIAQEKRCVLYVWYDNEAGYSHQVIRIAQELSGLRYLSLP